MRLSNQDVVNAVMLVVADDQHGLTDQRMKWIGDHGFECQKPGIMKLARTRVARTGRTSLRSWKRPYAARGIGRSMPTGELCRAEPGSISRSVAFASCREGFVPTPFGIVWPSTARPERRADGRWAGNELAFRVRMA